MTDNQLTIRFAGDSGDGMQLTGDRLAKISAIFGNEVSTLADYPAEIRAPQGTIYGVSGYQLQIGTRDVFTPGDEVDILIVMNPAALVANRNKVKKGGMIIADSDSFTEKNLTKVELSSDPLSDGSLSDYKVSAIGITELTKKCLENTELKPKEAMRCKNFFALGIVCWLLDRPIETTKQWIRQKFSKIPAIAEANVMAFNEGFTAALVREMLPYQSPITVSDGELPPGNYRFVTGNVALSLGLVSAAVKSKKKMFYGAYPITPASDILHELAKHRNFGVTTYQAEDEIAAAGSAVGAAYAGNLAITASSGPGFALKSEFLGLAVMTELPLVVIDVQRAGPSTGMPTKTEQSDLNLALWGRNGDAPVVVIAPKTPADCFNAAFEASKIAMTSMTPVVILSDAYLANGYESWLVPDETSLDDIVVQKPTDPENFKPYSRNENLSRSWVYPGMAGFEHRIGGLEKEDGTGNVCYVPENHQKMTDIRSEKVKKVAENFASLEVEGDPDSGTLLVGWGSTYGILKKATQTLISNKIGTAHLHLRYINPFHNDLEKIFKKYKRVIVAENNSGQAVMKLRNEFPMIEFESLTQVTGQPFTIDSITSHVTGN